MAGTAPTIIHRYGVFRPDGTAVSASARVMIGATALDPPPQMTWGGHDTDGVAVALLHVPMDDALDDWRRLYAEWHIWCDATTRDQGHGAPRGLMHSGWTAHPLHPHVRLGGALRWGHAPHPRVVAHAAFLASLSDDDLIRHICGPRAI